MHALEGLKIIDLTRIVAGPFCTMLLGDMGAEVIKVEDPDHGDDARGWPPFVGSWSTYFLGLNRSKKSLALDLRHAEGAEVLRRLLASADVLVENFRPGSLGKLGFSYSEVQALNPRLIYCSISGYGQTGPRRGLAGMDPVIQAESGFMDLTGFPDGLPVRAGVAMTDYLAGLFATVGILIALRERDTSGLGQQIDIALFDAMLSTLAMPAGILQATGATPRRLGNDHPSIAPYEVLRAKDGILMVAAANPRLWKQLCAAIGMSHLVDDPRFLTNADRLRHREALKGELEGAFAVFTVEQLAARLEQAAVPCGRVRTVAEALDDPQVAARQMLLSFDEPELEGTQVVANPLKLSRTPASVRQRPPRLGEHTRTILEELGYSEAAIAELLVRPKTLS